MENIVLPNDIRDFLFKTYLEREDASAIAIVIFFFEENCRYSQLQHKIYTKVGMPDSILFYRAECIYERNLEAANELGIRLTPSTIIYNGEFNIYQGVLSEVEFQKKINKLARICRNCKNCVKDENKIPFCEYYGCPVYSFDNCKKIMPFYVFK